MIFNFIGELMERFRNFNVMDVAIFKTLLLLLGAMFGCAFAKKVKEFFPIILLVTIGCYIWIAVKLFAGWNQDLPVEEFEIE